MSTKNITFLILLFCLLPLTAFPAELLVKAKPHWMDSFTQIEVDKMSVGGKQSYEARSQIGDIIVVRPDGWEWGKEECLPNFIVVKVPQMTEAEAKKYEESLQDTTDPQEPKLIRIRKYALPKVDITAIKTNSVTFTKTAITNKLITKTGLATEISAPKNNLSYLWHKVKEPLMVAYHYWIENAYAATQLLKTVKPSGGDYTSLEACMNANEQNLVTADKYFDVEIDGTWSSADTTAVTIHNYTTDATRYINIYTTAAARHKGIYSNSYHALENAGVGGIDVIRNTAKYIRITGLQLCNTATSQTFAYGFWLDVSNDTSSDVRISSCIIKRSVTTGVSYSNGIQQSGYVLTTWNNIIYNFKGTSAAAGIYCSISNQSHYNNTVYNCTRGIRMENGTITIKNNICNGNTTDYSGNFTSATNISQDITSPDGADYQQANGTAVFVNTGAGTEDFHLGSTDTKAIDRGTDLSATFTDDIDGVTRTGTWDIGADEYVVAASSRRIWIMD